MIVCCYMVFNLRNMMKMINNQMPKITSTVAQSILIHLYNHLLNHQILIQKLIIMLLHKNKIKKSKILILLNTLIMLNY